MFIPEADRATLCVSSQVGCALECKFCSTGQQGLTVTLLCQKLLVRYGVLLRFVGFLKIPVNESSPTL